MTILRFLFRCTGVASSGIDAYVRHSWHFMHKRNGDMEEEAPALHLLCLQLAKCSIIFSCWRVYSGENFVCYSWMSSFLGTTRGSRPSHTCSYNTAVQCHSDRVRACESVNFWSRQRQAVLHLANAFVQGPAAVEVPVKWLSDWGVFCDCDIRECSHCLL